MTNELLKGDYPFEVVGYSSSYCNWETREAKDRFGYSEKGKDQIELKLKFFKDEKFDTPLALWTERFVFHPHWDEKVFSFNLSTNLQVNGRLVQKGDEIEYDENTCMGLRGWATCAPREDRDKTKIDDRTGKVKQYNSVAVFITNKPKLAKHVEVADEENPY
jgi:hypothetical protein